MKAATGHAGGDDAELLDDAEREVRYPGALDHLRAFQFDWPRTQMVEQPNTPSEQDGHQVDVYLVEESRPYALLRDARGAHGHVLSTRGRFRLLDRAGDAVRDKRERRSFVDPFLWDRMGDDEGQYAQGRSTCCAPPGGARRSGARP